MEQQNVLRQTRLAAGVKDRRLEIPRRRRNPAWQSRLGFLLDRALVGFGQMKRRAFLGKLGGMAFRLAAAACALQRSKRIGQTAKEI
jgi:hypothetical protein